MISHHGGASPHMMGTFDPLQNAFKSYVRMRDYCATSKQIIAMCLAVIKAGFELGNYVHVNNYIQKAEQTPDVAVRYVHLHVNAGVCRAGKQHTDAPALINHSPIRSIE